MARFVGDAVRVGIQKDYIEKELPTVAVIGMTIEHLTAKAYR